MKINERVQLPAWSDAWMQGDRYGTVEKLSRRRTVDSRFPSKEYACVRLDKSGRLVRFAIDDLSFLD